jgi:hypothetical protein
MVRAVSSRQRGVRNRLVRIVVSAGEGEDAG